MEAPQSPLYSLPCEIWLQILHYAGDIGTIRLVDRKLNELANLWFEDVVRQLRQEPRINSLVSRALPITAQFKRLMNNFKRAGVVLGSDCSTRPQDMNSECRCYSYVLKMLMMVKKHYEDFGLLDMTSGLAGQAEMTDVLDPKFIEEKTLYQCARPYPASLLLSAENALQGLLQNTRINTLTILQFNGVTLMRPEVNSLTALRQLNITNNPNQQNIPSLNKLTLLTSLDISYMLNLEQLPDITGMVQLTSLHFTELPCVKFFPTCSSLPTLQRLVLGISQLEILPECLVQSTQLTYLSVGSMHSLQFWPLVTQLVSLNDLLANDCQLKFIPDQISRLTNLQSLYLEENQITTVPNSIGNLKNLESISLKNNCVSQLPDNISLLTNLQNLWVSRNRIDQFPNVITLTSLRELSLKGNRITRVPEYLIRLTLLQDVDLRHNPIEENEIPEALKSNDVFKFSTNQSDNHI